jgi:glutathione synthase/RimK-type ligase-like ATP-grasp enzyme
VDRPQSIGVLVPLRGGAPALPPEALPVGRAALRLAAEGIDLVFGDALRPGPGGWPRMDGARAVPGGWQPAPDAALRAVHDRFPSQGRAEAFARARAALGRAPMGNPPALTALFRDKLRSQRVLEQAGVAMPPLEDAPARFGARLAEWGAAFLKPRYGAHGAGVRRVLPGEALPAALPGLDPGTAEPALLQRALPPPAGWQGWSVRVLCQREADGAWFVDGGAARRSHSDPVVNAARGAEVVAAPALLTPDGLRALDAAVRACLRALDGLPEAPLLLEVGLDLVVDAEERPWLVELNGRPAGRLLALCETEPDGWERHVAACARPLRRLAAVA